LHSSNGNPSHPGHSHKDMSALSAMLTATMSFAKKFTPSSVSSAATPAALHPLIYLPFHLASHHMVARTFPHKHITYPLHLAFTLVQYAIEHYIEDVTTLAAFNGAFVAVAVGLVTPYTYYRAFKLTTHKASVWAALAVFVVALIVFKGLDIGFPKDDPAEQAAANLDRTHSLWHLLIHCILLVNGLLFSYGISWNAKEATPVPSSPGSTTHSTLSPSRRATKEVDCVTHGTFRAQWPKNIKAA